MRQVFTKIQAHMHTHNTGTYYSINFLTVFFSNLVSYPWFKWVKMHSHQEGAKCWELGSVYVHKVVLEACLACAHGNNTLTHPTSIITFATSFWSSPQQQRPGTCVSKRKETKMNAFLIGLPWWLRWLRSACNAGGLGSIPGSGRSPGEGNGNPLQYSCLEHSMDRGA